MRREHPGLQVAARTSSFYYKGKNESLKAIGETLDVDNLLEGSVRKSGDKLRITVQLNNAQTGYHLWSQTYDRPMSDVFAIQEDIAQSVATALQVTLRAGDIGSIPGMTRNVEAYEAHLAGSASGGFNQVMFDNAGQRAIDGFRRAIDLDPDFGVAWLRLANAYSLHAGRLGQSFPKEFDEALLQVERLIPQSPDHYAMMANISQNNLAWRDAVKYYSAARAAAEKQRSTYNLDQQEGVFLSEMGQFKDGAALLERARARDPLNVNVLADLASAYFKVRQLRSR